MSEEPKATATKICECPNPSCQRSSAPHIAEYRGTAGVMYAGRCLSCFMVGPKVSSVEYARKLWNELPRASKDLLAALQGILSAEETVGAGASIFQVTTAQVKQARAAIARAVEVGK